MAAIAPLPSATTAPTTYRDLYQSMQDTSNGDYSRMYASHLVTAPATAPELLNAVVLSSNRNPKVFLCRIGYTNNAHRIVAVHRPSRFQQDINDPSATWNDRKIAFVGDLNTTTRFIKTVLLPANAFEVTIAQTVPTLADMAAQYNNTDNGTVVPFTSGDPNTEDITTRNMVQVPYPYVGLVLGRFFSPRQLWDELATAIINDGRQVPCAHLLSWIRIACTRRPNPTNTPVNHMGTMATALVPVIDDEFISRHRWDIITRDIPQLNGNAMPNSQLLQIVGAMQRDQATNRAADEARCIAERQDKPPSQTKYRSVTTEWMQFCSVVDELDLPPIYIQLVNADKTEHIYILRTAVRDHAESAGTAPTNHICPVISKETKEMVLSARFGVAPHEINDLTLGLQPFAVGFFLGNDLGRVVESQATNYDLMLAGLTAPTMEEQATFSTKEVQIPQDPFTAGVMLATTSVLVDVVQGINHPFAVAFRGFCTQQWPPIATAFNMAGRTNPDIWSTVIPRMLRWVQTRMSNYFYQLLNFGSATIPAIHNLTSIVTLNHFNMLPDLPDCYRLALAPTATTAPKSTTASALDKVATLPSAPPNSSPSPPSTGPAPQQRPTGNPKSRRHFGHQWRCQH